MPCGAITDVARKEMAKLGHQDGAEWPTVPGHGSMLAHSRLTLGSPRTGRYRTRPNCDAPARVDAARGSEDSEPKNQ
ncbi:hypothetical protein E2562_036488 [Oryza meyeriana var. granulata]|uniref:Uncharacterized protein n=1 Tax=Oryza meyeriana var. granulata TaxID=110450 RepID=A0A6G1C9P5_9ORYZ|nr:hypothetical protein E2562_036488 [Oryza meyeriana var. granulata]